MNHPSTLWLSALQRPTTRAGFGCAGLMGALSRRESLRLLDAAWDAGVRYFDVAPVYGHGETEAVLGEFLRGRRDAVTLATKYGLEPGGNSLASRILRAVGRPAVRRIPPLQRIVKPPIPAVSSQIVERPPFNAKTARISLERSLRALRTECIDVFFLHEPRTNLLISDELLSFLEVSVKKGAIRSFGCGGERRHVAAVFENLPQYCPFVQCEWSISDRHLSFPGSQVVVFGVLSGLRRSANFMSDARAALRAAVLALPKSVILFSSRNPAHVKESVEAIDDESLDGAARQLLGSSINLQ